MAGIGHGVAEVTMAHLLVNLPYCGEAKGRRTFLLKLTLNQFHDAEQLIAKARQFVAEQSRYLFKLPRPPYPSMPLERKPHAQARRPSDENHHPQPSRRVPKTIQHEHQQIRQQQPEDRGKSAFGQADHPQAAAERLQFGAHPAG